MRKKLHYLLVATAISIQSAWSQCPTAPASSTYTVTSDSSESFTLGAGQTLYINSGMYTGVINLNANTGTIYVAPGATFNPSAITNFFGKLINCGTSTLPSFNFDNSTDTAKVLNYATLTLAGNYGSNQKNKWVNGLGAKLMFNKSLTLNNTNILNNGSLLMKGSFTINSVNNVLINHDSIIVEGSLTINASLYNDGFLFSYGNMNLNAQGNITNACLFKADKQFSFNGFDTLIVSGLLKVSKIGSNDAVFQGSAVKLTGSGFIQGVNFTSSGTKFYGNGNMYFTGFTMNQGVFGSDGKGLNFYDTGLPGCPSACKVFDLQNLLPHASVTKNAIQPKDSTYVPNTCSSNIKRVVGCINKPNAGDNQTTCNDKIDLPDATGTQAWYFLSGPKTPSLNKFLGMVSDMTVFGNYRFVLKDTVTSCSDTVFVLRPAASSINLKAYGDTLCSTATSARLRLQGTIGASYFVTTIGAFVASGTFTASWMEIDVPMNKLTVGKNVVKVESSSNGGCSVVLVKDTAVIVVNQSPVIKIKAVGDTVCSNSPTAMVVVNGAPEGAVVQAFRVGGIAIGSSVVGVGGSVIISIPVASLSIGLNKIIVSANIVGCSVQTVSDTANVVVNKFPSTSLIARGDTVIENETFAYPYLVNAEPGVAYQAYLNSAAVSIMKVGPSAKLEFPISVPNIGLGNHLLTFNASTEGCVVVALTNAAIVLVKPKLITSLEEAEMSGSFYAWPNPMVSELHIKVPTQDEVVKVTIQDALGVIVFDKTFTSSDISFSPTLTNGVYQLLVESSRYKHAMKFVKQQ